jgi:hypothetical protein
MGVAEAERGVTGLAICGSERVRRETAERSSLRVGVDLTMVWRGGGGGRGSWRAGRRMGEEAEPELSDESSSESEEAGYWCHGWVPTPRIRLLRLGSLGKGTAVAAREGASPPSGPESNKGNLVEPWGWAIWAWEGERRMGMEGTAWLAGGVVGPEKMG